MKKQLLVGLLCMPVGLLAGEARPTPVDTTRMQVNGKHIEVIESDDRLKVKVYETDEEGQRIDDELIFEGHYADGKSYENRKQLRSIYIPIPTWNRAFEPHFAGFGLGFANFADARLHLNEIDGVSLRSSKSFEINLNLLEKSFLISRTNLAVVTGAGMRWSRYRLSENKHFKEVGGVTSLHDAPEGITYTSSRLGVTSITLPLLLEWQNRKGSDTRFFVSAGVVGVIKTASSSRVVYVDAAGKKQKNKIDSGMTIRPLTFDFLLQAGYDCIGVYTKYSPMGLFEGGKGPNLHPVSIGLQFHF